MNVKGNSKIAEAIAKRLFSFELCPIQEQMKMIQRAAKDAEQIHKTEIDSIIDLLIEALPFVCDGLTDQANKERSKPKIQCLINRIESKIKESEK